LYTIGISLFEKKKKKKKKKRNFINLKYKWDIMCSNKRSSEKGIPIDK